MKGAVFEAAATIEARKNGTVLRTTCPSPLLASASFRFFTPALRAAGSAATKQPWSRTPAVDEPSPLKILAHARLFSLYKTLSV